MTVKKIFLLNLLVTTILVTGNSTAQAADPGAVRISGFLTTIFTKGSNNQDAGYNYGMAEKDVELDTRDNHLGVQFASTINPDMKVTAQMIARGGETNSFNLEADWAYVDYQVIDHLRFRIGKYKIPQFIASDYLDVGYAYPWVRPPQDVYGTNPLISLNGVDMLFKMGGSSSKLFLDLFYGDGTHDTYVPAATFYSLNGSPLDADGSATNDTVTFLPTGAVFSNGEKITFDTKKTVGFGIKYASTHYTVRAGYFKTKVTQDAFAMSDVPGAFGGVGFTMDYKNVVAYAEFIRRNTDPLMAGAFPDQDAWYTTLGYRMGKVLPSVTFSQIKQGVDKSPLAIEETSQAFDLRYDLAPSVDMKFEIMRVKPKKGSNNFGTGATNGFGLFESRVDKGTIYSLSFDVIF